jgi:MFS family permease
MKSFSFKDENGKFYYGWWIVIAATIITGFVYSGIVSVTGVFMLPVTQDLGLSVAAYSLYLTVMSITNIITLILISKHFTQNNIKKIMIIAGILGVLSFIGFAMAQNVWMFYVFAVPQGFCFAAMTMTPCQLLVSNWFGEKAKGRAISFFLTGMTLVYILELNVLNVVIVSKGWRTGYIVLAVAVAISIIVALKLVVWSPEEKGLRRIGDIEDGDPDQIKSTVSRGIDFSVAIKRPITWFVLISCTLAVIASSSILHHGVPTMILGGFSQEQAIAIFTFLSLVMIVTGPIVGIICDKLRLSVAAIGTALCFAGSTVGLSLISVSKSAVILFGALYIFGVASINIISPLLMNYMYGEKDLPRLIGYVNMFIAIGGAIGAAALGGLFEYFGSYQIPWLIMAGVLAFVAIIRGISTTKSRKYVHITMGNAKQWKE